MSVFFLNSGNVGIGTTTPSDRLQIYGNLTVSPNMWNLGDARQFKVSSTFNNPSYINNDYPIILQTGGGNQPIILDAARVGIGTTNPQYTLDVSGTIRGYGITDASDIRWKQNITNLTNSLDIINKLQGVNYYWNTEKYPNMSFDKTKQIGFIAQDVEKVIPELVKTDSDGYKSLAYDKMTAVLAEGMKEQQKIIENQNNSIKELKYEKDSEIEKLQEENTQLKSQLNETNSKTLQLEQENDLVKLKLFSLQQELCNKDNSYSWCTK